MNVELTTGKSKTAAIQGVSALAGGFGSNVAMSYAPNALKKDLPRVVVGVIALVTSFSVTGKTTVAEVTRGATLGFGLQQIATGVKNMVAKRTAIADTDSETSKKIKTIAAKGLDSGGMAGLHSADYVPSASAWENAPAQALIENSNPFAAV